MKNPTQELFGQMQKQHHRHEPWLSHYGGLYLPHSYKDTKKDALSWWTDIGFVLNGRRVIVWWEHPRSIYADAINDLAWSMAAPYPSGNWITDGATKLWAPVGESRKRHIGFESKPPSSEQESFYDRLAQIEQRLYAEGIEHEVTPHWERARLSWAIGVELVVPIEVKSDHDAASIADLARRLIAGKTALDREFPNYKYDRGQWLKELPLWTSRADINRCR